MVHSINGRYLCSIEAREGVRALLVTRDSEYVVTGGQDRAVVVRRLHNLSTVHRLATSAEVSALTMLTEEQHLAVGLSDGKLVVISGPTGARAPVSEAD